MSLFPGKISLDDMGMYMKEWALLGYRAEYEMSPPDVVMVWSCRAANPANRLAFYEKHGGTWVRNDRSDYSPRREYGDFRTDS